jgi:hypothetical protein
MSFTSGLWSHRICGRDGQAARRAVPGGNKDDANDRPSEVTHRTFFRSLGHPLRGGYVARMTEGLSRTALHPCHLALGAKMSDFGGWLMPIEYPGGGVLREHRAVREAVGVFDVGHLGVLAVNGPGAAAFLDTCLTNSLERIGPGRAQYTFCCASDGGVVDDLLLYLRSPEEILLVPNAANCAEVQRRLAAVAPGDIAVTDLRGGLGVIAVQGPRGGRVDVRAAVPRLRRRRLARRDGPGVPERLHG